MTETREDKVRRLFGESKKIKGKESVAQVSQVVSGHSNIVAAGNVTIHQNPVIVKTQAVPGALHISQEMAFKLRELVNQIVAIEANVKRDPRNHPAVWGAMRRKFKYSTLPLMPARQGEEAEAYLREQIGRLMSSKSAAAKVPDYRLKRYRSIHSRVKELGLEDWKASYLAEHFGAESLTELTDEDLERFYRAVFSKKPKS